MDLTMTKSELYNQIQALATICNDLTKRVQDLERRATQPVWLPYELPVNPQPYTSPPWPKPTPKDRPGFDQNQLID